MTHVFWFRFGRRCLLILGLAMGLAACATGPRFVSHSFSFDGVKDHWADSVDLLAYAYGDGYQMVQEDLADASTTRYKGKSSLSPGNAVVGPMPVGAFLHVKWRIKSTGEEFEKKVDLLERLPKDMTAYGITFLFEGKDLYVYLVSPKVQEPWGKVATHRTSLSKYNVTYEIYPSVEAR